MPSIQKFYYMQLIIPTLLDASCLWRLLTNDEHIILRANLWTLERQSLYCAWFVQGHRIVETPTGVVAFTSLEQKITPHTIAHPSEKKSHGSVNQCATLFCCIVTWSLRFSLSQFQQVPASHLCFQQAQKALFQPQVHILRTFRCTRHSLCHLVHGKQDVATVNTAKVCEGSVEDKRPESAASHSGDESNDLSRKWWLGGRRPCM